MTQHKWMTDGKDHQYLDKRHIFTTKAIENYITSDRLQFLISSKGMGKTLLLRYKRKELNSREAQQGIYFLPENSECDVPELSGSFSQKDSDFESIEFWSDLWQFSIILSATTHIFTKSQNKYTEEPIWDLINEMDIGQSIKTFVSGRLHDDLHTPASIILAEVIHNSKGMFARNRANIMNRAKEIGDQYITNGVYYFIDAFDSALTSKFKDNIKIWSAGQQGLILASYRLAQSIEHLKVFATIRQEAWNVFRHDDRQAISGKALNIKYTYRQLEKLFEQLIDIYEHRDSLHGLTGLKNIPNYTCSGESEVLFNYIYRHIIPSPRAFSIMGRSLSHSDLLDIEEEAERIVELRNIVNRKSIEIVINDFLFSQQKYFLSSLKEINDLKSLGRYIPSNILPGWSLESINYWFAKSKGIEQANSHPFCELYNIGLIGQSTVDPVTQDCIQSFREPNDFEHEMCEIVQKNQLYFLHPALSAYITTDINIQCAVQSIIIGQHRSIPKNIYTIIPSIFVSHSSTDKNDVKNWIHRYKRHLDIVITNKFWIDDQNIPYGGNISKYIEEGLKHSALLFLFLTKDSIDSGWVEHEWKTKQFGEISNNKISIIVILKDKLEYSSIPSYLSGKKYFKFEDYENDDELKKLALNCRQLFL